MGVGTRGMFGKTSLLVRRRAPGPLRVPVRDQDDRSIVDITIAARCLESNEHRVCARCDVALVPLRRDRGIGTAVDRAIRDPDLAVPPRPQPQALMLNECWL